ncbi:substrate-binding domain-containing protein [Cellulosimicrobium cellulans]|uniref:LacI family DNA-binding transcriptional regulator n=1 Tax=Cellulosimicrobium cellulans TaxID=1710 RepID=UPI0028AA4A9F|nr:substrate-binding domain-containing protein [Cellulosimicrobium cellulans]
MIDTERMVDAGAQVRRGEAGGHDGGGDVGFRAGLVQHRSRDSHDLNPFFAHLVAGMEESLEVARGVVLVVFEEHGAGELEVYERWAQAGLVDTVVLTNLGEADGRVERCLRLGLRVVVLGPEPVPGVSCLVVDEQSAVRKAVEHLAGLGHRRVARVRGPLDLRHTAVRARCFHEELGAAGMVGAVLQGDYSTASGEAATATLIGRADPPTAIVYDNDLMAIGGLRALERAGVRTPEDVTLLAWDDSPYCQLARPALSAVSRDVRALGATLGELVVSAAGHGEPSVVQVREVQVVHRGTSGAPPRQI